VSAHLIVKSKLSELRRVSDWINEWAGQHGLSNYLAQRLDLCSTEAVTNIISYAYDDNAEHPIALRLCRQNDLINLEVQDDGKPFNPLQIQACARISSLENARIGGWGIPIVRRFSDAADYRHAGGKNCLRLSFRCGATAPP
jgi:serine/threonine-protein kinase RsbW